MLLCRFAAVLLAVPAPSSAQGFDFPPASPCARSPTNGATIHVRSGGTGPAVVLLHGYGETGDMWVPLAVELARDHTVIVPDLRGLGLSSKPAGGFDKKTQAGDVARRDGRAGRASRPTSSRTTSATWWRSSSRRSYPERVRRLVLIDAPVPGVGPWEEILKNPLLWHFRFGGPDMERLVAGRERIYLDRFWNEFSASPDSLQRSGARALREALRAAGRDALRLRAVRGVRPGRDRQPRVPRRSGRLKMPVLALGGEKSFGPMMADRDARRRPTT